MSIIKKIFYGLCLAFLLPLMLIFIVVIKTIFGFLEGFVDFFDIVEKAIKETKDGD